MHSWAILGGSYVNAWVCFWLGGTKSTLYKCTLKQLPALPTAAPTQTSDCAAAWLAYLGGKDGCGPFQTACLAMRHMCRDGPVRDSFEKHNEWMEFYIVMKRADSSCCINIFILTMDDLWKALLIVMNPEIIVTPHCSFPQLYRPF